MYWMKGIGWRAIALLISLFSATAALAEHLVIAGTGDSQVLLRNLAEAFQREVPGIHIVVPDSIGSGGGVKAVTAGMVALARTARPLKAQEKRGAGAALQQFPLARSPIVFAVPSSLKGVEALSSKEVLSIFSGETRDWNQLRPPAAQTSSVEKIYPVMREEGDSSRTVLEKTLSGFRELNSPAKRFFTTQEAADAIRDHRQTIGFLPYSWARKYGLKVLRIDHHSIEESPYMTPLYLVSNGEPAPEAQQFIDFIHSPMGQSVIRQAGMLPWNGL